MHVSPRPGGTAAVRKIVLHVNVGPEVAGGAAALARYLTTVDAGYHEIVDNATSVQTAAADKLVYGAAGMNEAGYHICLIGNVQTVEQWHDTYSAAELAIAAKVVARRCLELGIPPDHLADVEVADPNARGICDHWAVNRAIVQPAVARGDRSMGPGDHTDVGPGFPWAEFMSLVRAAYSPAVPPAPPKGDTMRMIPSPVPAATPNRFRGVNTDIARKVIVAVEGAVVKPDPKTAFGSNVQPWIGIYTEGLPAGEFVVVTEDHSTYHFTIDK